MSDAALYLTDLRAQEHAVTYEAHPAGGFRVKGLPVLKPGVYHGITFDAGHLEEIAANFRANKEELGYEPPLRPFHPRQGERVDVRKDLLGVLEDCYLEGQVLKTDVRVWDEETVRAMQEGRFPYLSGEFRINTAQRDGKTALRGLAFVDAPECKGLPWRLVMNAEEFPEEWQADEPATATVLPAATTAVPAPRGGDSMTLTERVKALFGKGEVTREAVLAALEEPQEDPELAMLRERAEKAEAELAAIAEREAAEAEEQRRAQLAQQEAEDRAAVEALLAERHIVPAQQETCLAILTALRGQETVVQLSEASEESIPVREAFLAMLREGAAVSEKYFAQLSTATPNKDEDTTLISRMLASQGFKAQP